jgi:hypothetical protein
MRVLPRHITAVLLILVVSFTSVQLAAARGQAPAVGTMVICTGSGPLHILVDENGVPTGGVMICPDYAMAFYAEVSLALPEAVRSDDAWRDLWHNALTVVSAGRIATAAKARGPPDFV